MTNIAIVASKSITDRAQIAKAVDLGLTLYNLKLEGVLIDENNKTLKSFVDFFGKSIISQLFKCDGGEMNTMLMNRHIVDKAHAVIAIWDGNVTGTTKHMIELAREKGIITYVYSPEKATTS